MTGGWCPDAMGIQSIFAIIHSVTVVVVIYGHHLPFLICATKKRLSCCPVLCKKWFTWHNVSDTLYVTVAVLSTGSPAHLQHAGSHYADVGPRGRSLLLQVSP